MVVVIVGAGAMGCRFGGALHKAGAEVWLYDVSELHVNSIKERGLIVHDGEGVERLPLNATTDIASVPPPDLAVIFTKAIHTKSALEQAVRCFTPDTAVLTMQNGLGSIELISQYTPQENIIAGITNYASDMLGPGEIEAKGSGISKVMPLSGKTAPMASGFVGMLNSVGCHAELTDNIMKDIWEKVAFNAALNTITAITGLTVGGVGSTEEGFRLAKAVSSEVIRVAHAEGVEADGSHVHEVIESVFDPEMSGDHKTSMLQDVAAKRRTEADAICGVVLEKAFNHGLGVRYLETVYLLIKMIEHNYLKNPGN